MSDILVFQILLGLVCVGYLIKLYADRQFNNGFSEAIAMHHSGELTYTSFFDDDGEECLEIKIMKEL